MNAVVLVANLDERGGLQKRARRLARSFAAHGGTTLATWTSASHTTIQRSAGGIRIARIPSPWTWRRDQPSLTAMANTGVSVARMAAFLIKNRSRWDAVLAMGLVPEGLAAALACTALKRPFVIDTWLAGPIGNVARFERSPFRAPFKALLKRAAAFHAGTPELVRELVAAGFPPDRVKLIVEAIDSRFRPLADDDERRRIRESYGLPAGEHILIFFGRFDLRQKRVDLLLDAWDAARPRGWSLLLAGEGPDETIIRSRAASIPNVRFLPWQPEPARLVAACDLTAMPTKFEGTGIALLEACGAGVPGIASEINAYLDLRPAGVLLVPNKTAEWAAAIADLTGDDSRRETMSKEARRWAEARQVETDAEESFLRIADPTYNPAMTEGAF